MHATSPIPGVEPSIMQQPQRIHMTLGVMSLVNERRTSEMASTSIEGQEDPSAQRPKTIDDALAFLNNLRPEILELMKGAPEVQVPLRGLDIMNEDKNAAYVVWTGPGSK